MDLKKLNKAKQIKEENLFEISSLINAINSQLFTLRKKFELSDLNNSECNEILLDISELEKNIEVLNSHKKIIEFELDHLNKTIRFKSFN